MGPVTPKLFNVHRGRFSIGAGEIRQGNSRYLSDNQRDTIDRVLSFYGKKTAQWLSDLAHSEDPWVTARNGIPEGQHGDGPISLDSIRSYYESLR